MRALRFADNRPSTIAAPCPARSENSPRPAAPSRRRAIASTGIGSGCSRFLPRSSRSRCSTASISRARMSATPLPFSHAARKRLASSRRQKKQGRCPAANAVASSRKNSSVQLRPPITLRRQPRNSQTQVIQAGLDQRFFSKVLVAGSWMMPRLPVNRPRCGVAMMSPVGVTRFCSGISTSANLAELLCRRRRDAHLPQVPDAVDDCRDSPRRLWRLLPASDSSPRHRARSPATAASH